MSSGTVSVGGIVSCTVTVNDSVAVLPAASVAVHSTSVLPIGNSEPEGGSHKIVISPPISSCMRLFSSSSVAVPSTLS